MKTILRQLYDGELYPCENFVPGSPEYRACEAAYSRHQEEFCSRLRAISPELAERYAGLRDDLTLLRAIENEELFYYSFRLGMTLLAEALC